MIAWSEQRMPHLLPDRRAGELTKGFHFLQRYFLLIVWNSFLADEMSRFVANKHTDTPTTTARRRTEEEEDGWPISSRFVDWLEDRREINTLFQNISLS